MTPTTPSAPDEVVLDEKALKAATVAIVNVWDDHRGVDPNLSTLAETAIRAYLRALKSKPIEDGWIEWGGGACPVPPSPPLRRRNRP